LADNAFTPTSIENVEFPDDLAPVAFQANRAAMSYNSKKELQELEAMNQQTAAYPTLTCLSGPMAPNLGGGSQCEVGSMESRSHAITAYSGGTPLFPQFYNQKVDTCATMQEQGVGMGPTRLPLASGDPPIGYREAKPKPALKHMGTRMMNSVRGALYDLQHFNELPPAQSGEAPSEVAKFALSRDNRLPYIFLVITCVLMLMAVAGAVKAHMPKSKRG
jgi:hypothetical protein